VSFKNTVIITLPRCLKRDEEKESDKSCVINKKCDVLKSRPPIPDEQTAVSGINNVSSCVFCGVRLADEEMLQRLENDAQAVTKRLTE
jgi:hypothetical protein